MLGAIKAVLSSGLLLIAALPVMAQLSTSGRDSLYLERLLSQRDSLMLLQSNFKATLAQRPGRTLKGFIGTLDSLNASIMRYQANTGEIKRVQQLAITAQQELKKLKGNNTRQALRLLTNLQRTAQRLPERFSLPVQPVTPPQPVLIPLQDTTRKLSVGPQQLHSYSGPSWAVAALGLVLLTLAAWLGGWLGYRRMQSRIEARLRRLEAQERNPIPLAQAELPSAITDLIRKELQQRWELMENSTYALLEKLEFRLSSLEERAIKTSIPAARQEEAVITSHEQAVDSHSANQLQAISTPTSQANVQQFALQGPLQALALQAPFPQLRELAAHFLTLLQQDAPLAPDLWPRAALLLQLSYAATQQTNDATQYLALREYFTKQEFIIEDVMAGRMAFSDHLAENIALEEYLAASPRPEEPPPSQLRTSLQQGALLATAVKNTVLYVLSPTVQKRQEGVKLVVRRGRYVVKG